MKQGRWWRMRSTNRSNWVRTRKHSPPTAEGPSSAPPPAYHHCCYFVLAVVLTFVVEGKGRELRGRGGGGGGGGGGITVTMGGKRLVQQEGLGGGREWD